MALSNISIRLSTMKGAPVFMLSFFIFALVGPQAQLVSSLDYEVSGTFDDFETYPDLYSLDDEPMLLSPGQLNQEITGPVSDLDTNIWAEADSACFLDDAQSTDNLQKRNDACSSSGSPPGLVESGMKTIVTPASEDADICQILQTFGSLFFAVCDSGRESDRILNQFTGEYSLFHCERRKP